MRAVGPEDSLVQDVQQLQLVAGDVGVRLIIEIKSILSGLLSIFASDTWPDHLGG